MRWIPFLFLTLAFAGCLDGDDTSREPIPQPDPTMEWAPCEHPWPCGDGSEWPADLAGPFEAASRLEPVEFSSHDGTILRGWLNMPAVPDGTPVPTIVSASPYHGLLPDPGGNWGEGPAAFWVEHGFAFLATSVRGTGASAGCFQNKGLDEQLDQAATIDWVAEQPWSNGRVGMIGLSYPGTTPWMAAINNPAALKTIVPLGPVTDVYTEMHTPQGALYTTGGLNEAARRTAVTAGPVGLATWAGPDGGDPVAIANIAERACPGVIQVITEAQKGHPVDERDATYWGDRQLILRFPEITSSVYMIHGLQETAHPYQEEVVWNALDVPRRALLGQWDHETPTNEGWEQDIVDWMDFWLKGIGEPPMVGVVDYQDDTLAWHATSSWPPAEVREEALVFDADLSFRSIPGTPAENPHDNARAAVCSGPAATAAGPISAVALSEPAASGALIAGNPYALLQLTSSDVGGQIAVHVFRVPEDCANVRLLGHGVADLRFHDGVFTGHDFPVNEPATVRVDIINFAETISAGDRIGVVFSYGDQFSTFELDNPLSDSRISRTSQPYYPLLTVGPGSHLVLPFVEGTLGLQAPDVAPPPRPFAPIA